MKTILFVDDEPGILEIVSKILRQDGYNVVTRSDGESALSYVNGNGPVDLVITDYLLPNMTGLDLLTEIRQRMPDLPLIFCTGSGSREIYLKAITLGVFAYLNKPVRTNELCRIAEAALRNARVGEVEGTDSRRSRSSP